ncbi:MAG: RraA family protein, partial [Candidatus Humimicrobiaceae bacterium]
EINNKTFKFMKESLYSGVLSDILDDLGYREQAMDACIRPVIPGMKVAGKAMTILSIDVFEIPEEPYKLELEALDQTKEGEVLVVHTNYSTRTGFWGELLSTLAARKGANGAVMDAYTRDAEKIIEMGFPVFTTGFKPVDSKGRSEVVDYRCPIQCGGVNIDPGDIIFGDIDGIVAIPPDVAIEVIGKAYEKVDGENKVRDAILSGMGAAEVYEKYGIL